MMGKLGKKIRDALSKLKKIKLEPTQKDNKELPSFKQRQAPVKKLSNSAMVMRKSLSLG